jgi:hypothetical protein
MEVTLRKATRLVNLIDDKIDELKVKLPTTKLVFVHDNTSDVLPKLDETRTEFRNNLDLIIRLYKARETLRTLLGSNNETSGVDMLVTKLNTYQMHLHLLKSLRETAGNESRLSDREIGIRLDALRTKSINKGVTVTSSILSKTNDDDYVKFNVLTREDLNELETDIKVLTKNIESVHDQLERINNTVVFDVPEGVAKTLVDANII